MCHTHYSRYTRRHLLWTNSNGVKTQNIRDLILYASWLSFHSYWSSFLLSRLLSFKLFNHLAVMCIFTQMHGQRVVILLRVNSFPRLKWANVFSLSQRIHPRLTKSQRFVHVRSQTIFKIHHLHFGDVKSFREFGLSERLASEFLNSLLYKFNWFNYKFNVPKL